MKLISTRLLVIYKLLFLFFSCDVTQELEDYINENPVTENLESGDEFDNLEIPDGFDFSTQQEVKVTINDNSGKVKYDIYAYTDEKYFAGIETFQNEEGETVTDSVFKSDVLNKLIYTGATVNGTLVQTVTIPQFYKKLYIRRKHDLKYSASIETISNNEVQCNASSFTSKSNGSKPGVEEYFYGVNGSGDLFQVDPLNGDSVYVSDMPMGSYSCAIDQENKVLYSVGRRSPYPLMKYSIETNEWETVTNLGQAVQRLEFNNNDDLLYFSSGRVLSTLNPLTGIVLNSWDINGISSSIAGDLAFSNDGSLFLCSFSGVYKLELTGNNEYQSTKINNNLPFLFFPTAMVFDSNNKLWVSNFAFNSNIISIDTSTGNWTYEYGYSAGNSTNIGRSISDLSVFKIVENEVVDDSDNDGVPDNDDAFPEDPNKAFVQYTPSENGWGALAFEDLWPHKGDYDFNDVALKYRVETVLNADNLAVQVNFVYNVKANGASSVNGFGLEMESLVPSQIESISGLDLKHGYINQAANGTELGQDKAVIIMFDDAYAMLNKEVSVSINFSQPINQNNLGTAPFNPFMIINKVREMEVHLPFKNPTSLGNKLPEVGGVNYDNDGNYVTNTGLPWAINILTDFKVPIEKVGIAEGYNYFSNWATSGGSSYDDWYRDNPGYINYDKVVVEDF